MAYCSCIVKGLDCKNCTVFKIYVSSRTFDSASAWPVLEAQKILDVVLKDTVTVEAVLVFVQVVHLVARVM